MGNSGNTGPVHKVKFDPKTGRNDVFFGKKGEKAGHAVVDGKGKVLYARGSGKDAKASIDSKKFLK